MFVFPHLDEFGYYLPLVLTSILREAKNPSLGSYLASFFRIDTRGMHSCVCVCVCVCVC